MNNNTNINLITESSSNIIIIKVSVSLLQYLDNVFETKFRNKAK